MAIRPNSLTALAANLYLGPTEADRGMARCVSSQLLHVMTTDAHEHDVILHLQKDLHPSLSSELRLKFRWEK